MGLGKRAKDVVLAGSYLWPVPSTALMHKLYQYWFLFWGKAPDLSHQSELIRCELSCAEAGVVDRSFQET